MSLMPLGRRTLMRGGATIGSYLAFLGAESLAASAQPTPAAPLTGALIGWLKLQANGAALMTIIEVDDQSHPKRLVATQAMQPMGSIVTTARRASDILATTVAESWQVALTECTL